MSRCQRPCEDRRDAGPEEWLAKGQEQSVIGKRNLSVRLPESAYRPHAGWWPQLGFLATSEQNEGTSLVCMMSNEICGCPAQFL